MNRFLIPLMLGILMLLTARTTDLSKMGYLLPTENEKSGTRGGEIEAGLPQGKLPVRLEILRITATFGEPRIDHFHNGLDIAGNNLSVTPLYAGEIVFYSDAADNPSRQMYGPGNVVVMEHKSNIRTLYYHLQTGSIQKEYGFLTDEEELAKTGNTGRSGGPHLHLSVEDTKQGRLIDPFLVLPAFNEQRRPRIYGIYVLYQERLRALMPHMRFKYDGKGSMKLYIKAHDIVGVIPTGVRKVSISIDDNIVRSYDFSELHKQGFDYFVSGYPYEEVYGVDPYYYRGGEFTPTSRQHIFSTEVEDFSGNITTMSRIVYFY